MLKSCRKHDTVYMIIMYFNEATKRKTNTSYVSSERLSKRTRMISCSNSDSGRSSMSGNSSISSFKLLSPSLAEEGVKCQLQWPLLSIISKTDEPIPNGTSRRRFPDPIYDKSVLFACNGYGNKKLKLRLCSTENTMNLTPNIFLEKDREGVKKLENTIERSRVENCSFFLSLEFISIGHSRVTADEEKNIMLCDVREHAVASTCLPEEVTGFWVRTFGPRQKFTLQVALWQVIHKEKKICHLKKESFSNDHVMKVNELRIEFENDDSPPKPKKTGKEKNKDKSRHSNPKFPPKCHLSIVSAGNAFQPTFCSKELYIQVTMCLRECIENGKFNVFSEMYDKFLRPMLARNDRDSVEFKLLLSCEKSQFHAYQGDYVDAKKLLQHVVGNVVGKSPNKTFLLNRAYLYLANVHLMEENCGTAEECLNVLHFDKKNGSALEDITLFYVIYAVTLMMFSKKLPQLSDSLRSESLQMFTKAESCLQQSLPMSLNRMCWTLLQKARLFLYKHYSRCSCVSSVSGAVECVKTVEKYGEKLVSERNKCLLMIVKSEIFCFQKNIENADRLLDEAETLARRFHFHKEKTMCETFRTQRNELSEQLFIPSSAPTTSRRIISASKSTRDDDVEMNYSIVYDADESS